MPDVGRRAVAAYIKHHVLLCGRNAQSLHTAVFDGRERNLFAGPVIKHEDVVAAVFVDAHYAVLVVLR